MLWTHFSDVAIAMAIAVCERSLNHQTKLVLLSLADTFVPLAWPLVMKPCTSGVQQTVFSSSGQAKLRRTSDNILYSKSSASIQSSTSPKKISVVMPMISSQQNQTSPKGASTSAQRKNSAQGGSTQYRRNNVTYNKRLQASPYGIPQRSGTPAPQSRPSTAQNRQKTRRGSTQNSSQPSPRNVHLQRSLNTGQNNRASTPYRSLQPTRQVGVSMSMSMWVLFHQTLFQDFCGNRLFFASKSINCSFVGFARPIEGNSQHYQ